MKFPNYDAFAQAVNNGVFDATRLGQHFREICSSSRTYFYPEGIKVMDQIQREVYPPNLQSRIALWQNPTAPFTPDGRICIEDCFSVVFAEKTEYEGVPLGTVPLKVTSYTKNPPTGGHDSNLFFGIFGLYAEGNMPRAYFRGDFFAAQVTQSSYKEVPASQELNEASFHNVYLLKFLVEYVKLEKKGAIKAKKKMN